MTLIQILIRTQAPAAVALVRLLVGIGAWSLDALASARPEVKGG